MPRSKIHVSALVLLLVLQGVWIALAAARGAAPIYYLLGALVLAAAAGAALSQRWSRFLIYALAAAYAAQWLWVVLWGLLRGSLIEYLRSIPVLKGVLSFVPAAALFLVIGYCCYVAHTYIGRREGPI